jgi:Trk K+ transport system NAD-binding subunit
VIPAMSRFSDRSIAEIAKRYGFRSHIIAIRPSGGKNFVLPTADTVLKTQDQVVMIGSREEIQRIKDLMQHEREAMQS